VLNRFVVGANSLISPHFTRRIELLGDEKLSRIKRALPLELIRVIDMVGGLIQEASLAAR
jgi:hypothetical protein